MQDAPADAPAAAPVAAPFGAPAEPSAETGGGGDGDDNELAKEEEAQERGEHNNRGVAFVVSGRTELLSPWSKQIEEMLASLAPKETQLN